MLIRYLSTVVTALLVLHVLCLVIAPYSRHYYGRLKRTAFVLGVLCIVCLPATSWVSYSFKLRPDTFLYTIALGNLAFLISLTSARYSLKIGWHNFVFFYRRLGRIRVGSYALLMLLTAVYEEAIWRGAIQMRLGNNIWAILLVVPLFYLAHVPPTRKFRIPRVIDLCALTLIQGFCFYAFNNLTMVIGIHFIKNLYSHVIRYEKDPKYSAHIDQMRKKMSSRLRLRYWTSFSRSDSVRMTE